MRCACCSSVCVCVRASDMLVNQGRGAIGVYRYYFWCRCWWVYYQWFCYFEFFLLFFGSISLVLTSYFSQLPQMQMYRPMWSTYGDISPHHHRHHQTLHHHHLWRFPLDLCRVHRSHGPTVPLRSPVNVARRFQGRMHLSAGKFGWGRSHNSWVKYKVAMAGSAPGSNGWRIVWTNCRDNSRWP